MTAPIPDHLDEPRAQPDHDAMDDTADWAVSNREFLEGMLVVECPEVSHG